MSVASPGYAVGFLDIVTNALLILCGGMKGAGFYCQVVNQVTNKLESNILVVVVQGIHCRVQGAQSHLF